MDKAYASGGGTVRAAICSKNVEALMSHYTPDILLYDLAPPLISPHGGWSSRRSHDCRPKRLGRRRAAGFGRRHLQFLWVRTLRSRVPGRRLKDFGSRGAKRERFERLFLRHKTLLLEEASHFLHEHAGDRIAESIQVFMREVSDHGAG
jgi:hypothetical protein